MASNMFSRFLPPNTTPSVYETLRQAEEHSEESDVEERAGLTFDDEFDQIHRGDKGKSRSDGLESSTRQPAFRDESPGDTRSPASHPSRGADRSPEWLRSRMPMDEEDEANDDVPMSLLMDEDSPSASPNRVRKVLPPRPSQTPDPAPFPVSTGFQDDPSPRWRNNEQASPPNRNTMLPFGVRSLTNNPLLLANEKEKAMWRWTNVTNLDVFLQDVYWYYTNKGIYSIILARVLHLLTLAFIVGFGVFLMSCIDYSVIPSSRKMSQIIIPKCTQRMGGFMYLSVCIASFLWFSRLFQDVVDMRRLWHMHNFFTHLLEIPESDIQGISWQTVVAKLMALRDLNPDTAALGPQNRRFLGTQSKQRMDAHDIANRLMRRENYLISLINKDILDLTLPIPYIGDKIVFSQTMQWNLSYSILDFVFDKNGQVNPVWLGSGQRKQLSEGLKSRFRFAAVMNIISAPFALLYLFLIYFFRYFNEYQRNPGQLTERQYTPLAQWKFREFNEVPHMFEQRLKMSDPFATRYINQFPKDKTIQLARFIGLIAGAIASVLVLASLWDPEMFLGFEITKDRTVLFYTTLFVAIWRTARNSEPEENLVFDPEYALETVIEYTHYHPTHWRGRLHSEDVRKEFAELYKMKVVIFAEELLSILLTPFVLMLSLPNCSDRIVDFFREFTVHVDGLGYVCSFAVFDFQKGAPNLAQGKTGQSGAVKGSARAGAGTGGGAAQDHREGYYATKDNKMLQSYFNFMDAYVTNPDGKGNAAKHAHEARQHRQRRNNTQNFHPPPAFPGLVGGGGGGGSDGVAIPERRYPTGAAATAAATGMARSQRVPNSRFAAFSAVAQSPMASMLLDPQHQLTGGFRPAPTGPYRSTMQSTLRKSRLVMDDVIGEEEEGGAAATPGAGPAEGAASSAAEAAAEDSRASAGYDDYSQLGESWKTTRAGYVDGDDESLAGRPAGSPGRAASAGTGAGGSGRGAGGGGGGGGGGGAVGEDEDGGVLGMVYQFSKAQTRGGVQI